MKGGGRKEGQRDVTTEGRQGRLGVRRTPPTIAAFKVRKGP